MSRKSEHINSSDTGMTEEKTVISENTTKVQLDASESQYEDEDAACGKSSISEYVDDASKLGESNVKNQFLVARKQLELYIGKVVDLMTHSGDKYEVRETLKCIIKERDELRRLTDIIVGLDEPPVGEIAKFTVILNMLEQKVEKIRYDAYDFIKYVTFGSGSVCSKSRSRASRSSWQSSSSGTSNKQQLDASKKEVAALKARLSFIEQENQMKRKSLENELELQALALKKELAEKQAIKDECKKIESLENPFPIEDDISQNDRGTSFKEVLASLPQMAYPDKVKHFVLNQSIASADSNLENPRQSGVGVNIIGPVNPDACLENDGLPHVPQVNYAADTCCNYQSKCRNVPLTRIPNIKVWVFNGDETEFMEWEGSFKALVEDRVHCVSEKMNLLKQHLGPGPMKVVKSYFLSDTEESYRKAIAGLKSRYGSPVVVGQSILMKLKSWRPLKEEDKLGLRDFADFLEQVAEIKKRVSELNTLDYASNHVYIVKKLPPSLMEKWRGKISKYKMETQNENAYPPFEYFVLFVKDQAERRNLPEFRIMDGDKYFGSRFMSEKTQSPQSSREKVSFGANVTKLDICSYCEKQDHSIADCPDFGKLPFNDRKAFMHDQYLCFGCGCKCTSFHKGRSCSDRAVCKACGKFHLTSMHKEHVETVSMCTKVCGAGKSEIDNSMLVPVWIRAKSDPAKKIVCYAAIDIMSNCSFISEDVKRELGLKGNDTHVSLSTMHGSDYLRTEKILDLEVLSYDEHKSMRIGKVYVRQEVPALRSQIPRSATCSEWKHLQQVAEKLPPYLPEAKVGILIGSDVPGAVMPREVVAGKDNEPFAMRTDLGWGLVGKVCIDSRKSSKTICNRILLHEEAESANIVLATKVKEVINPTAVKNMFELEFAEHQEKLTTLSVEDRRFLKIISDGIKQRCDKHYEMPLPLRDETVEIPYNKSFVAKRTMQLGKRLIKQNEFRSDYVAFMSDILKLYAEEVPVSELDLKDGKVNYLIHMGVYHPHKPNKIRVVFDGSAKFLGMSLNDYLLTGPDLLNKMLGVLCRMRKYDYALSADLKSMFFQFFVSPQHRNLLRFFWWENDDIESGKLKEYRLKVHLFGACSSPSVCNFGLKRAADDGEHKFGTPAADFIRDNFYMDDGLISLDDENELIALAKSTSALCENFGMKLCKFVSNSRKVLDSIAPSDLDRGMKEVDLKVDPLPSVRTLGIVWCIENDSLQFRLQLKDCPCTRRNILSTVSSIYDPLGQAAVLLVEPKLILQSLCRAHACWDDPVPDSLRVRWEKWRSTIHQIESLQINRCYKPPDFGEVSKVEFHHFSDASNVAYGQCSYVRMINIQGRVSCALVIGKARVAPLNRQVSIPRLELSAAVVSARISRFMNQELKYKNVTEYFWVDSMVVLGYIKNEAKRFHTFVANRVQTIHDNTDANSWFYVPSAENPSDDASRGISIENFSENCRWLCGPDFLWVHGPLSYPGTAFTPCEQEKAVIEHEMRKATAFKCTVVPRSRSPSFAIIEASRLSHISKWITCVRSIASLLRFLAKLQKATPRQMSSSVLDDAERLIVRSAQYECFANEMIDLKEGNALNGSCALFRLRPFLDEFGVLRLEGRMENSCESYGIRHPILIPKECCITNMLVLHFHERTGHSGRYMTLNAIRQHGYWLVHGSSVVSRLISRCVICRRKRRPLEVQKMADLPVDRFMTEAPFTYVGCDVFGVYHVKEKRSVLKRYCVIFNCMSSRAIHLESLNSMTTDSFINALRRFLSRRGPMKQLRCDCGTNFVGACNELKKAVQEMDQDKVKDFLLNERCDFFEFKFTVPHGSHMSGAIERQIFTVKSVLNPLLLKFGHVLCDESYRTFLVEVENIVNSRPLSVESLNDASAPVPLSPQHILTLKSQILLPPPGIFQKADQYLARRWRRVQYLANEFWHKWKREYVSSFHRRQKWNVVKRNFVIGDIVLISDPNCSRNHWSLGRVESVFPSADNLVRKVKVLVGTRGLDHTGKRTAALASVERPIHKLVLLVPID